SAKAFDTSGVRRQVLRDLLAAPVSVSLPGGLGAKVPMGTGMRTFALDFSATPRLEMDSVFEMDAITARTHRMIAQGSTELALPPVEISVMWSAMKAPRSGWAAKAVVDDVDIRKVARDGISRVGESLPEDAGAPVLAKVRADVWAETIGDPRQVEFPAGATLGAHSLGFLAPRGETTVSTSGNWIRLSSAGGHVLARP